MAYLDRRDQMRLLQEAHNDTELANLMRKIHFDDDVLYECAITVQPVAAPKYMIPGA